MLKYTCTTYPVPTDFKPSDLDSYRSQDEWSHVQAELVNLVATISTGGCHILFGQYALDRSLSVAHIFPGGPETPREHCLFRAARDVVRLLDAMGKLEERHRVAVVQEFSDNDKHAGPAEVQALERLRDGVLATAKAAYEAFAELIEISKCGEPDLDFRLDLLAREIRHHAESTPSEKQIRRMGLNRPLRFEVRALEPSGAS